MKATRLEKFLSPSARGATRNEIRELLKLIAQPDIISLAGGLPSPETFPIEQLAERLPGWLRQHGTAALQYGATEGDLELREALIRHMVEIDDEAYAGLTSDHVLITSGSQQGLDLCGRVFLAPGDVVVCGLPSYLGALGAFTATGARMSGVPLDDEGLRTDLLEQRLIDLRRDGVRPKFIYAVPDFQNPAGVTLSLERRHELLAIAREFDLLVVEDSPYRQLRYVGESLPSLGSLDRDGRVITLFTFSKILSPGLRLGWSIAAPEITARLVVAKQPVDLCTSGFNQFVAREYLKSGLLPAQLARIRELYALKRGKMLEALDRHIDPEWGVSWTRPEGGLFVWMSLPQWMDGGELLQLALEEKVAFVTGRAFHCDGLGHNTMRLNFSFPAPDELDTAVERLARCIGTMIQRPRTDEVEKQPALDPRMLVSAEHSLEQLAWNLALSEVVE